jgi:Icc-related predicted phosphoesterase
LPVLGNKSNGQRTRLFFATDVHSSEKTFNKFLSAAEYYKIDALILGGDLTGKFLAPFIKESDGSYFTDFQGNPVKMNNEAELKNMEEVVRTAGYYVYHTTRAEYDELRADKTKVDRLFEQKMLETLERWINLAEDTLKKSGVNCYITGGNDDPFAVDDFMRMHNTDHVKYCEGEIVDVGGYEMAASGYSNMTPWKLPRDLPEDQLEVALDTVVSKVKNYRKSIFTIHVPPYDTGLDLAIWLSKDLKYQHYGQPIEGPIGSHAVFNILDKYQPLLSLHGHVHESRCFYKLGKTMCFNPGSEYTEGTLRGVIINLKNDKMESYQFTSG